MERYSNRPQVIQNPHHVYFFAGAAGGYPDLRAVQGEFDQVLGHGKGTVYNSAFFAETPRPERFQDMAYDLKTKLQQGPVTLIGHSYGAIEAVRTVSTDPEIKEKYLENLKVIFISPAFPKNWWEGVKDITTYGKILVQEARVLGVSFPGKSSIVGGVASAVTMPSDVSRQKLMEAAQFASPHFTHGSPASIALDFLPRDYLSAVDQNTQDRVRAVDKR